MRFEPRIKVVFYDVTKMDAGPVFTGYSGTIMVYNNKLWVGGKLVAGYNHKDALWHIVEGLSTWPAFRMEVI